MNFYTLIIRSYLR